MKALFSAAAAMALIATAGCAPTVARQGFQVQEAAPRDVKVGEDTKSSVLAKLGSPSAVATFEPNIWYYIAQTSETYTYHKPKVSTRDVTAVTFDKDSEKVVSISQLSLKDGKRVAYSDRETPTRGRELTVLEQMLGNVGRTGLPPTDENTPGQRRRD